MENKITRGLRLSSMLVDHFIMTFIVMFLFAIGMGLVFFMKSLTNDNWLILSPIFLMGTISFSVYLNKDAIRGQSPAKRILKNQVIDNETGEIASPLKCLIRNLILPVWIIEIPFVLIDPQRRLGDKLAGTRIEFYNPELKKHTKIKDILITVILGTLYMTIIMGLYLFAMKDRFALHF